MQPLKITYALPGSAPTCYNTVAQLQAAGHDVTFEVGLFFAQGSRILDSRFLPSKIRAELRRRHFPGIDGASVRLHPTLEALYIAANRMKLPLEIQRSLIGWRNGVFDRAVARRATATKPDVVIGKDTSSLHSLRSAKSAGSLAVLNQMIGHNAAGEKILREEAERHPDFADSLPVMGQGRRWQRLLARCTAEAMEASLVLAPSQYVKDTLIEAGCPNNKIEILPFGVDTKRFKAQEAPSGQPFRLLFIGQISQRKGIKYLLEAFRRLKLPNAELCLVGPIIGSGAGLAPYKGLYKHVKSVPYSEIQDFYRNANLFVFPSLHEGSATVVYEALASGVPVITTPNAGSVVRDGEDGFLVPIRDVEALMERINTLYQDEALRRAMGEKARQRAATFTWDHYGQRLEVILRRALEGGSPCYST